MRNSAQQLNLSMQELPYKSGNLIEESHPRVRGMEDSLREKIKKLKLTEDRHRALLAYASVDFSGVGKQKYDEDVFYGNQRYKWDSRPPIYTSCTLETIGGNKITQTYKDNRSVAPFAYDPINKKVSEYKKNAEPESDLTET